ncbi:Uncharacterised protein [Halioglobus japonicus]|nr:Uncharacterised protein [Halioglobus japonicus]
MHVNVVRKISYAVALLLVPLAIVATLRDDDESDVIRANASSLSDLQTHTAPERPVTQPVPPSSSSVSGLPDVQDVTSLISNDQQDYGPDTVVNIGADIDVDDMYYGESDPSQPLDIGPDIDVDDRYDTDQSYTEVVNIGEDVDVESIDAAYNSYEPVYIGPDVDVLESGQVGYDASDVVIDLGDDIYVE